MTIASYSDLQAAVSNWIIRADLTERIPEFITLAEAKFNRSLDIRQMESRATLTVDLNASEPQYLDLPDDFQSMRRICLSNVIGRPTIEYLTPTALYEMRFGTFADDTGQPAFFTIIGDEIELAPLPDQAYTIELVYRQIIPALTDSNTTNWLLTLAPDAYLYGALMEASLFMINDDRVSLWAQEYAAVIEGLTSLNFTSDYNAGPLSVRPVGYTP